MVSQYTRNDPPAHRYLAGCLLYAIVVAAAVIRLFRLDFESLWYDELYVVWARSLPLGDLIPEVLASEHPPLYNMIGVIWGDSHGNAIQARSLSALLGATTVLLVYLVARDLFSRRTGLWAAAFAAAAPILVWYSRDATSYSWVIFISLASLYLLVRCCQRGGWKNWVAYTAVTAVAVCSHFSSPVLLVAECCFFLVLWRGGAGRLRPMLASQAFLWILTITLLTVSSRYFGRMDPAPLALDSFEKFFQGVARAPAVILMGYADHRIGSQAAAPVLGELKSYLLIGSAAAIAALLLNRRVRSIFRGPAAALALFTFAASVIPPAMMMLRGFDTPGRMYVWAVAPALIVLAVIVTAAPRRVGAIAGACIVAGLMLTSAYQLSIRHNEDFRAIMEVVEQNRLEGDMLLSFPEHIGVLVADFYLSESIRVAGGFMDPKGLDGAYVTAGGDRWSGYIDGYIDGYLKNKPLVKLSGEELRERMENDIGASRRFWLLEGKNGPGRFCNAAVVREVLDPDWDAVATYDFPNMVLTLYQRS